MKKKLLLFTSYVLVAAISAAVTFGLCAVAPIGGEKLQALESLILECFVGEADRTVLEDAAANAMVSATGDRWSYYISADAYASYEEQMENAYVGVGITIMQTEEGFAITAVTPGSGAEAAGILAGDVLIRAEDQDIRKADTETVRSLVRGEEGTFVSLTLLRDGEEKTLSVERRRIQTPVATGTMLEGQIGYIVIENFDSRCAEEAIACIEELRAQGAESLIFDVRYNPGGYADELVKLLDYLLPEGDLFRTERYDGVEHVDRSDATYLDMPMAVLVNADSYSAAEFFAAAMQEYEAATIVGVQTVGKGYFQNTFRFEDGSAVALSVGKYYTPKGVSLANVGITPDIICPVDEETEIQIYYGTLAPEEDPQLAEAIRCLTEAN